MSTDTSPSRTVPVTASPRTRLWPTAVAAALVAAAATTAVAALADVAGVPIEVGGEAIVLFAFPQLTFVFSMVGLAIAAGLARWNSNPRRTWVRTTVALTALSLVPDLLADADLSTRLVLMLTHLVAAAIVVPAVAARLERG